MSDCLQEGTLIIMHDGSILPIEKVHPGMHIMGNDSEPRLVEMVVSSEDMLYEIHDTTLTYNECKTHYIVTGSHILCLVDDRDHLLEITVDNYLKMDDEFKSKYKGYRGMINHLPKQDLDMDSYKLGTCYGKYILNIFKFYKYNRINSKYMISCYHDRAQLLAGILDTCGVERDNNILIELTSKDSFLLLVDILYLCRILGIPTFMHSDCLEINVNEIVYYYLQQKECKFSHVISVGKHTCYELSYPIEIIKKSIGKYYGFQLDGNNKFLLGNMVVAHNCNIECG